MFKNLVQFSVLNESFLQDCRLVCLRTSNYFGIVLTEDLKISIIKCNGHNSHAWSTTEREGKKETEMEKKTRKEIYTK